MESWNHPVTSMSIYGQVKEQQLRDENKLFLPNRMRVTSFYYTKEAVQYLFQVNNLSHLIRAHECVQEKFKEHFGC